MAVQRLREGANNIRTLVVILNQLQASVAELKTKHNAAMTKLDADAGVTDANYNSTQGATVATPDTVALEW